MDASEQIDRKIAELTDWQGKKLAVLRKLINEAGPGLKEIGKLGLVEDSARD